MCSRLLNSTVSYYKFDIKKPFSSKDATKTRWLSILILGNLRIELPIILNKASSWIFRGLPHYLIENLNKYSGNKNMRSIIGLVNKDLEKNGYDQNPQSEGLLENKFFFL